MHIRHIIEKLSGLKAGAMCIIAVLAWLCACSSPRKDSADFKADASFAYGEFAPSDLTCIVLSEDSSILLLGSNQAHFTVIDNKSGMREDFPLPEFTSGFKTYDIMQLDKDTWLVAKQNNGILYLNYGFDDNNRRVIRHLSRVTTPSDILPAKDTRYSVYSFVRGDSVIAAGSSNGLLYLTIENLKRLEKDTLIAALYAAPLLHLRNNRYQFAQESMFRIGDSLLTVTDSGIYRLAFSDFGNSNAKYDIIDSTMRCWNAAILGDTLAVIWSPGGNTSERELNYYTIFGEKLTSSAVPSSTVWIGNYDGSLRCFGEEGSFPCFHSAVFTGGKFYFINDGTLCVSNPRGNGNGREYVRFVSGNYIISDRQGLFRIENDGSAKFLGDITDISGLRGISHSGNKLYLATSDGVYSADATGHFFPHHRNATLIEKNNHLNSDRVEAVYASGDTLLIGTRNGLHALFPDGKRMEYKFPTLESSYESPYVKDITRQHDGSFLLKTLNFGTWTLSGFNSTVAVPSSDTFPDRQFPFVSLSRPETSWESICDIIIKSILILLAITGAAAIFYFVMKRRHHKDLTAKEEEITHKFLADRSISVSIKDLETKLRDIISKHADEVFFQPISHKLSDSLKVFENAGASDEDKSLLKKEYHNLKNFCDDSIRRAHALAVTIRQSSFKRSENYTGRHYPWEILTEFANKIEQSGALPDPELLSGLTWLDSTWTLLDDLLSKLKPLLVKDCVEAGLHTPNFYFEDLASLWNVWVAPMASHTGLNISQGKLTEEEEHTRRGKTLQLTAVSFLGCENPVVNGKSIPGDARSMVRCDDSTNLGTAYKYWAAQFSEGFFEYEEATFPEKEADLLWIIRLKDVIITPDGLNPTESNGYPLSAGIRIAYARMYGLEPPGEVMKFIRPRRRGRPAKR